MANTYLEQKNTYLSFDCKTFTKQMPFPLSFREGRQHCLTIESEANPNNNNLMMINNDNNNDNDNNLLLGDQFQRENDLPH